MSQKLAIKRLTISDLTFFEWQYRGNPSSKQKAINLNADIFVEKLYPGLGDPSSPRRFPVDVLIYGPGLEGAENLQRKILKPLGGKNWRLNGELVANPENNPQRFNALMAGDFAIFDFSEGLAPVSLSIVFIATEVSEDKNLHQALNRLLGDRKMIALTASDLDEVVKKAEVIKEHPVYIMTVDTDTLDADVEDIALGGSQGRTRLISKPSTRKISHEDLRRAKENADDIGLYGEQFVNDYLLKLKEVGKIRDFEWVSLKNAISPYDFRIDYDGVVKVLVDVKSTKGEFERVLHVSFNELLQMRAGPERYDIYRVFDIKEATAKLCIAEEVKGLADQILQAFESLPMGVLFDSVSFSPTILSFGSAIALELSDQLEE